MYAYMQYFVTFVFSAYLQDLLSPLAGSVVDIPPCEGYNGNEYIGADFLSFTYKIRNSENPET